MSASPPTPRQQQGICALVRQGVFPHVAAAAYGVSRRVFREWLRQHPDFAAAVREAAGQARATAEMKVRKDGPLNWLKYGPGRERRGRPGWSASGRARADARPAASEPLQWEAVQKVITVLLEALAPYAEARAAAAAVLTGMSGGKARPPAKPGDTTP